ncbi:MULTISPECIES: hypothetical protein [Nguyenibacter]|uniref:Uncharacterized protein n=1 Tax=Nguyenibacter vanlangensis TaxID=1216886 RepID=A0A7Y7M7J7_9PROT|nr:MULTISPECIES: hypothetical protein [Nguyenibacter]NVN11891.1 hypothetical protein [Nguyenibacter vanlangensis]WRH88642.1 hypothetical protein QN315_03175 [Nguyenibacter sp. L1]
MTNAPADIATDLIARYGAQAAAHATDRMEEARAQNEIDDVQWWTAVLSAIEKRRPPSGKA